MKFRTLSYSELELIRSIDRSEKITQQYCLNDGELSLKHVDFQTAGFDQKELEKLIEMQAEILMSDGTVIGAFEKGDLVGVVSIDNRLFGDPERFAKMDILYVSAGFRGMGIGKSLVELAIIEGVKFNADHLYISATPTRQTVDFYLSLGAKLIQEPEPKLLELEPEDIHLSISIN